MSFSGDEVFLRFTDDLVDLDKTEDRIVDEVKISQNHELINRRREKLEKKPLWDIGEKIPTRERTHWGDCSEGSSETVSGGVAQGEQTDRSVAYINYTGSLEPDSLDYDVISYDLVKREGIKYGIPRAFYRRLGNSGLYKRIAGHLRRRGESSAVVEGKGKSSVGYKTHTCEEFGHQCSVCLEVIPIGGEFVRCTKGHTTDYECAIRWKNSCGLCRSTYA